MMTPIKRLLSQVMEPKAIILGFSLFHFWTMLVFVLRIEYQRYLLGCTHAECVPFNVGIYLNDAISLFYAALALFVRRVWGYPLAMVFSGIIIYGGGSMFSMSAIYKPYQSLQPSDRLEFVLAVVIFCFSVVPLLRYILQGYRCKRDGV